LDVPALSCLVSEVSNLSRSMNSGAYLVVIVVLVIRGRIIQVPNEDVAFGEHPIIWKMSAYLGLGRGWGTIHTCDHHSGDTGHEQSVSRQERSEDTGRRKDLPRADCKSKKLHQELSSGYGEILREQACDVGSDRYEVGRDVSLIVEDMSVSGQAPSRVGAEYPKNAEPVETISNDLFPETKFNLRPAESTQKYSSAASCGPIMVQDGTEQGPRIPDGSPEPPIVVDGSSSQDAQRSG
jgi:hypothetical protein